MELHHARLFVGKHSGFCIPDEEVETTMVTLERFGIADARALTVEAGKMPTKGSHRRFCISVTSMTNEAQNALLKLFEDPPSTARFELQVPKEDMLIATVRSRLDRVTADAGTDDTAIAELFMRSSYADRLEAVAAHTKDKDTTWIASLLDGLEVCVSGSADSAAREALLFVRQYDGMRGASQKMLLEHVALTLPVGK